jgi:hypothetical protein
MFLKQDDIPQSSFIEGRIPEMREMTEKRPRVLENLFNYFIAMIICLSGIW